ncbi:hypothetical protein SMACR_00462 [Sordaria macrospora]|uniref:Uncharacterized protein n=1 Tax=Sordaria macrospora TaxID=5147 RepID=A0A8S8ZUK4_SORMA|nr:hypothetical protein SMACR_00462 [Sordaria macrospora]WPJ59212.1 hypothetical protein SMAC4_00462 [Sordaria macrospora]
MATTFHLFPYLPWELPPSASLSASASPPGLESTLPAKPKLTVTRFPSLLDYQLSQTYRPFKEQVERYLKDQRLAAEHEAERIRIKILEEEERRKGEEMVRLMEEETVRGMEETCRRLEESMTAEFRNMQSDFGSGSGLGGMMGPIIPGFDTRARTQQAMTAIEGQMEAMRHAIGGGPEDIRARIRVDIEASRRPPSEGIDGLLREFGIDVEGQVRAMEENQERMMREAEARTAALQTEMEGARRGRIEGMVELLREETQRRREADAMLEEEAARLREAQARMAAMGEGGGLEGIGPMGMNSGPGMRADRFDMGACMGEMGASSTTGTVGWQSGPAMTGVGRLGGTGSWGLGSARRASDGGKQI